MAQITPYQGASQARLLAMINADNRLVNPDFVLLSYQVVVGPPLPYSDARGRNTKVTLTPTQAAPFEGPVDVHYTRLPLDVLLTTFGNEALRLTVPPLPFTTHSILPAFNELYGVNIDPSEVENTVYTTFEQSYPIKVVNSVSLAWHQSNFKVPVRRQGDVVPLPMVIRNTNLNGLFFTPSA